MPPFGCYPLTFNIRPLLCDMSTQVVSRLFYRRGLFYPKGRLFFYRKGVMFVVNCY